jgi:hypothetical protein
VQSLFSDEVRARELLSHVLGRLPKGGIQADRMGGSNGLASNVDIVSLLRYLHLPGSTPRQSRGLVWVPYGKSLRAFYCQAYTSTYTIKQYEYALPWGDTGQLELAPRQLEEAPSVVTEVLRLFVGAEVHTRL